MKNPYTPIFFKHSRYFLVFFFPSEVFAKISSFRISTKTRIDYNQKGMGFLGVGLVGNYGLGVG